MEEHNRENLEHESIRQQVPEEPKVYTPRPKSHIILAWILIAVVLFAFLGSCYWIANGGL